MIGVYKDRHEPRTHDGRLSDTVSLPGPGTAKKTCQGWKRRCRAGKGPRSRGFTLRGRRGVG
eukprot:8508988-Pyramimonas_sp.AAC.1